MLNANVPDKAGDIGKSSGRFGNGTKLSHRQTQLFSHNADWFHQICIVRENCGNIKRLRAGPVFTGPAWPSKLVGVPKRASMTERGCP